MQAIAPIHGGTGETLLLCNSADFPKLALTIIPHERLNLRHDEHIIWRDEDDVYRLDAGAFTISGCIDDSKLDEHFTDLGAPGETNKIEGFKALQLAQRLHNASRTFFQLFWLVANGKGVYDHKGRKIPPYGVYVGIEARTAEYMRDTEEKLLGVLGAGSWPADVLNVYQDALRETRHGYKRWEDRGNSGASEEDLWNNPDPNDLSAVIRAIDKWLGESKGWLDTSSNA